MDSGPVEHRDTFIRQAIANIIIAICTGATPCKCRTDVLKQCTHAGLTRQLFCLPNEDEMDQFQDVTLMASSAAAYGNRVFAATLLTCKWSASPPPKTSHNNMHAAFGTDGNLTVSAAPNRMHPWGAMQLQLSLTRGGQHVRGTLCLVPRRAGWRNLMMRLLESDPNFWGSESDGTIIAFTGAAPVAHPCRGDSFEPLTLAVLSID